MPLVGFGKNKYTELDDTPNDFTGDADKYVKVKHDESGLEHKVGGGGGGDTYWGTILGTLGDQTDLDNRFKGLEDATEIYEIFELIAAGTSGTVSKPTSGTILLDRYEGAADALITKVDASSRPLDESARTAASAIVTTTLDVDGNYTLSGTPSAYPVAIIYQVKIKRIDRDHITDDQIVAKFEVSWADDINYDHTVSSLAANNVKDALDELQANKSATTHNHDSTYLGINAKAADADKLDGNEPSAFATAGHNHDLTYLGISAQAADSDKLDGNHASAFATSGHNHTGTYEPANSNIQSHITDTSNPHSVTKTQVGLGSVTNDAQLPLAGGTITGGIALTEAPSTDQTATGLIVSMTYGESITKGDLLYFKSDGKVWKADANGASMYPCMGLALATASSGSHDVLLLGIYRDDGLYNLTVGGLVYLSTTTGAATQTQPSAADDVIQVVGIATHADRIYFNPQLVYITHT